MTVTPAEAVDAALEVFGHHAGCRSFHAKGLLCRGTFTPTSRAGKLTAAAHMQAQVQVLARLSNGAGNPKLADYAPDVRGLAVKFELPDGSKTDIVSQSLPRFPFSHPDGFVEFVRTQKRPEVAWRLPAYLAGHPRHAGALMANLPALRLAQSYATIPYYGIHAFSWEGAGASCHVRYTWAPQEGDRRIGGRDARRLGRDYLQDDMRRRLQSGSVRFTLRLQIAAPGDEVDDPSHPWPQERERVDAGMLELTEVMEAEEGVLVFDPTNVCAGIGLTQDPVLRFRREAYSESARRRSS